MKSPIKRLTREQVYKIQPALPQALLSLTKATKSTLPPLLIHLIKIRVSQINGCAFCLAMHAKEARQDDEEQTRLDLLSAWREADCFTKQERVALLWAETLTLISEQQVPDAVYQQLDAVFSPQELVDLTTCVIEINSWNRIAISFRA